MKRCRFSRGGQRVRGVDQYLRTVLVRYADHIADREVSLRRVPHPVHEAHLGRHRLFKFRAADGLAVAHFHELHACRLHRVGVAVVRVLPATGCPAALEPFGDAEGFHAGGVGKLHHLCRVFAGEYGGGADQHGRGAA